MEITGSSESAQKAFVEAMQVNPMQGGVFMTGTSENGAFISGAAITVVTLKNAAKEFHLTLVVSDRFTIDLSTYPFIDTEDFQIIGSRCAQVKGRLTGRAEIFSQVGEPLVDVPFIVAGNICIK